MKVRGLAGVCIVCEVVTAGKPKGVGVWRLRRRARLEFEADGQRWNTFRDLELLVPVPASTDSSVGVQIDLAFDTPEA